MASNTPRIPITLAFSADEQEAIKLMEKTFAKLQSKMDGETITYTVKADDSKLKNTLKELQKLGIKDLQISVNDKEIKNVKGVLENLIKEANSSGINIKINGIDDAKEALKGVNQKIENLGSTGGITKVEQQFDKIGETTKETAKEVKEASKEIDKALSGAGKTTSTSSKESGILSVKTPVSLDTSNIEKTNEALKDVESQAEKTEQAIRKYKIATRESTPNASSANFSKLTQQQNDFQSELNETRLKVNQVTDSVENMNKVTSSSGSVAGFDNDYSSLEAELRKRAELISKTMNMSNANYSWSIGNDGSVKAQIQYINKETKQTITEVYRWQAALDDVEGSYGKLIQTSTKYSDKELDRINAQIKAQEQLDKAKAKYQSKLSSVNGAFANTNEYKNVQSAINNLTDVSGIENVETKFEKLNSVINAFKQNIKGANTLDPIIASFRKMDTIDDTIRGLELDFQKYGLSANEAKEKTKELADIVSIIKNIDINKPDGIVEYGRWVGELNEQLDKVKSKLKVISKEYSLQNKTGKTNENDVDNGRIKSWENMVKYANKIEKTNAMFKEFSYIVNNSDLSSAFIKAKEDVEKLNNELMTGKITLSTYNESVRKLRDESGISSVVKWQKEASNTLHSFNTKYGSYDAFQGDNIQSRIKEIRDSISLLNSETDLSKVKAEIKSLSESLDKIQVPKELTKEKWGNKFYKYLNENTKAARKFGSTIEKLKKQYESIETVGQLNQFGVDFTKYMKDVEKAGLTGLSTFDKLKKRAESMSHSFVAIYFSMYDWIRYTRTAINTIKELDYSLVDLKKTTSMSASELNDFYFEANESAKKYGVTTKEIIEQASSWSRLGYSSQEEATKMAELSSKFAAISPGMDTETAQNGLVSIMKAWGLDVDQVEDEVISKINTLGNNFAESNQDLIEGMKRSAAALAATGTTYTDAFAIFTGAQEILQNSEVAGRALRSISMRIHGYSEDSEDGLMQVDEELKNITGDLIDLTKTAEHSQGVSIFKKGSTTEFKSLVDYFGEINAIWSEMDQKQQNDFLQKAFGKTQANEICLYVQKCA